MQKFVTTSLSRELRAPDAAVHIKSHNYHYYIGEQVSEYIWCNKYVSHTHAQHRL